MSSDFGLSHAHPDDQRASRASTSSSPRHHNTVQRSASATQLHAGRRFTTVDDHTWTYVRDALIPAPEIMGYGNIPIPSYRSMAQMSPDSTISIRCVTWNINEKSAKILNSLCEALKKSTNNKFEDIVSFALQELPSSSRNFHEEAMQILSNLSSEHVVFLSNRTWSQMVLVLIRKVHIKFATEPSTKFVPAAMLSKPFRTKGGIGVCFRFYQRWIVIIGCHFSHESVRHRIQDYNKIVRNMSFPTLQRFTDVKDMFGADIVIISGDLNFRLTANLKTDWQNNNETFEYDVFRNTEVDELELLHRRDYALTEFKEKGIEFAPTYKFKPGTNEYSQKRIPSYTDRVIYRCKDGILAKVGDYDSVKMVTQSDHKPVYCIFSLNATDKPIPKHLFTKQVVRQNGIGSPLSEM